MDFLDSAELGSKFFAFGGALFNLYASVTFYNDLKDGSGGPAYEMSVGAIVVSSVAALLLMPCLSQSEEIDEEFAVIEDTELAKKAQDESQHGAAKSFGDCGDLLLLAIVCLVDCETSSLWINLVLVALFALSFLMDALKVIGAMRKYYHSEPLFFNKYTQLTVNRFGAAIVVTTLIVAFGFRDRISKQAKYYTFGLFAIVMIFGGFNLHLTKSTEGFFKRNASITLEWMILPFVALSVAGLFPVVWYLSKDTQFTLCENSFWYMGASFGGGALVWLIFFPLAFHITTGKPVLFFYADLHNLIEEANRKRDATVIPVAQVL